MAYNHRLASVVWDRGAFWNHQPTEAFHSICSWTAGRVSIWRLNIFKTRAIGKVLYLDGNSNGNIRITCLILEKSTSLIGFFHGVPSVSAPFLEKTLMWATKHTWTYIATLIPGMWKWAGVLDPKTWQTTWSHDENNPQGGVCGAPPVMWRLVNPMNTIVGGNWNSQYIPILLPLVVAQIPPIFDDYFNHFWWPSYPTTKHAYNYTPIDIVNGLCSYVLHPLSV